MTVTCRALSAVYMFKSVLAPFYCYAAAKDLRWEPVPIVTEADVNAGRPGGEGFQVVESLVYAPSNPSIMYLSTNTSQVWKSEDAGQSWQSARKGIKSHGAAALAVLPDNPNVIFAAGTHGKYKQFSKRIPNRVEGIYRSVDGGESWQLVRSTHFNVTKNKGDLIVIVRSAQPGVIPEIYAGSHSEGLIKSSDLGDTWITVNGDLKDISDLCVDPGQQGAFFLASSKGLDLYDHGVIARRGAGLPSRPLSIAVSADKPEYIRVSTEENGVYQSFDGGVSFVSLNANKAVVLEVSQKNSSYLFAKRDQSRERMPIISHDGGRSWRQSTLLDELDPIFDRRKEQFWFSAPIAPHPSNPNIVFTVSNGKGRILKSIDAGKTWLYSGSGFTGGRMKDIEILPDGRSLFAFTDHGIWVSDKHHSGPFHYLPVPRVFGARSVGAVSVSGDLIAATVGSWSKKALVVSENFGRTWRVNKSSISNNNFIVIDPLDSRYIYSGNYISRNRGRTWERIKPLIQAIDGSGWLYAIDEKDDRALIVLSKDRGRSWKPLAKRLGVAVDSINSVAVSHTTPAKVYVGTNRGLIIIQEGKWRLIGEKEGMNKDDYGLLVISGVVVSRKDGDIVYAARRSPGYGQSNGVFMSLDGGVSWENINNNLGKYLTVWSIYINQKTGVVYIGTSLGTFRMNSI